MQAVSDHLRRHRAFGDRGDEAVHLAFDLAGTAGQRPGAAGVVAGEAAALVSVGGEIVGDQRRVLQLALEAAQDGAFDRLGVIGAAVVARAAFAHARAANARFAGTIGVVHHHATAAGAAAQQPGQQTFRAARGARRHAADGGFSRAGGAEDVCLDDCQVWSGGAGVLAGRVGARDAAAGVGVLDHPHLVPDDRPHVDLVQQDSRAALAVAVEGGRRPGAAARRRHSLAIEGTGDRPRRLAGGIGGEDPAHDRRLGLVDHQLARPAGDRAIAVGASAGVAPLADDAGEAAADLLGAVLALQLADQAEQADRRRVQRGTAGMNRADRDAGERQALVDVGEVAHVARQAICVLDDEHVESAGLRRDHQRHQAVAAENGRARLGAIGVRGDDVEMFVRGEAAAQSKLILDRALGLEISGKSGVERGAGHLEA